MDTPDRTEFHRNAGSVAAAGLMHDEKFLMHFALRPKQLSCSSSKIEAWIAERSGRYPPKSPIAVAIGYIENQKASLFRFLEDVTIPLDNNGMERALRIIAFGRKNFLFARHEQGAQNLAVLQSTVAICQLHEINPYEYIRDILIRLQIPGERMPWTWSPKSRINLPKSQVGVG